MRLHRGIGRAGHYVPSEDLAGVAMKKRPSDKQMQVLRRRHATRAIRETLSYGMGWPENQAILVAAWEFMITKNKFMRDWYGWTTWLGHTEAPRLAFDPFEPY